MTAPMTAPSFSRPNALVEESAPTNLVELAGVRRQMLKKQQARAAERKRK